MPTRHKNSILCEPELAFACLPLRQHDKISDAPCCDLSAPILSQTGECEESGCEVDVRAPDSNVWVQWAVSTIVVWYSAHRLHL